MIILPSEGGAPMPLSQAPEIKSNFDSLPNHVNLFGNANSRYPAYEYVYHGIRQEDPTGWINKSHSLSLKSDSVGYPSTKSIFHAGDSSASRYARSSNFKNEKKIIFDSLKDPKKNTTKILLNVSAERVFI